MLAKFAGHLTVYLVTGYTDMRKSIDGLAAIVQSILHMDPFSRSMLLFCGRMRNRIKALLWEDNGFIFLYKRLDNSSFKYPQTEKEARLLSEKELRWLLDGLELDQPKAIKSGTKGCLCTGKKKISRDMK